MPGLGITEQAPCIPGAWRHARVQYCSFEQRMKSSSKLRFRSRFPFTVNELLGARLPGLGITEQVPCIPGAWLNARVQYCSFEQRMKSASKLRFRSRFPFTVNEFNFLHLINQVPRPLSEGLANKSSQTANSKAKEASFLSSLQSPLP